MMLACLTFTSCDNSKDYELENDSKFVSKIVGTWKSDVPEETEKGHFVYDQLKEDGSFLEIEIENDVLKKIVHGTWTLSGDKLNLFFYTQGKYYMANMSVLILTDKEMVLKSDVALHPFVKVADSEIDGYVDSGTADNANQDV